ARVSGQRGAPEAADVSSSGERVDHPRGVADDQAVVLLEDLAGGGRDDPSPPPQHPPVPESWMPGDEPVEEHRERRSVRVLEPPEAHVDVVELGEDPAVPEGERSGVEEELEGGELVRSAC